MLVVPILFIILAFASFGLVRFSPLPGTPTFYAQVRQSRVPGKNFAVLGMLCLGGVGLNVIGMLVGLWPVNLSSVLCWPFSASAVRSPSSRPTGSASAEYVLRLRARTLCAGTFFYIRNTI